MRTFLIAFALAFFAGIVLTWAVRNLAIRWGMYDAPEGGRKIHKRPIPRLGGVAVAISFFFPIIGLALWSNDISSALFAEHGLLISLLGGGSIILAVGIRDDLKGAGALIKLIGQITAAFIVFHAGVQIDVISVPFVGAVKLGAWSFPVTVFWIVLITNALNLIDGLDGLAGGVAVLAGTTLFIMSLIEGDVVGALLLISMVGATLGFLRFNWNPASIFLGDTGSLFLGFLLATVSAHSSQKSFALFSIVAAFVALALPIFDLSMAVVRRYLTGKPMFSADQYHVHHMLLRKGLTQRQAAWVLLGGTAGLGAFALLLIQSSDWISALAILTLALITFVVIRFLGYAEIIKAGRRTHLFGQIEKDARDRAEQVEGLRSRLLAAEDEDVLWRHLQTAAQMLSLEELGLEVLVQDGSGLEKKAWLWTRSETEAGVHIQTRTTMELPIQTGRLHHGTLRIVWLQENSVFQPHQRALAQVIANAVANAMFTLRGLDAPAESHTATGA
jgi:UDP-GlcNAc:undecaprenyl-phosphate GlcNAc-1-phosphate transferase